MWRGREPWRMSTVVGWVVNCGDLMRVTRDGIDTTCESEADRRSAVGVLFVPSLEYSILNRKKDSF
jgi:hypothetical protein